MLALALLLQWISRPAFAHASLVDAQPADGAVLSVAPEQSVLHFNEPVAPLVFKLAAPDGSVRPLDQIAVIDDGLAIRLPKMDAAGTYLLSWRVISADGHPVGGALSYSVGAPSAGATLAATASPTLTGLIWLSRFGLYISLFFAIGGLAFRAFIGRDIAAPARCISALLIVTWVLLPISIAAHGLDALSASWAQLRTWQPWRTSLGTTYGLTIALMLAASLFACAGNLIRQYRRAAGVAALCLLGLALAASGHASSAPPGWLARPAVFLHALAICLWIGSLPPLLLSLRTSQGAVILTRFSRVIPWVLVALLISGATLSYLQLPRLSALWLSDYGKILCVKLVLLAILLAVAAVNRYAFTFAVERGDPHATRWMRRLIVLEIGLVLLILAAATTWRFTPPPRALAAAAPVTSHVHIHAAEAMADLTLAPHHGQQLEAQVFLMSADGTPLKAKEVTLQFSDPAQGLEPLEETTAADQNGTWKSPPFALPAATQWHVRIDILISDFESISLEGDIDPQRRF